MKFLFNVFIFSALSFLGLGAASCQKDSESRADIDEKLIVDYLSSNNLTASRHSSGLYYKIQSSGSGMYPSVSSVVTVRYKGWLLDGTVFDQTGDGDTYTNRLYNLIEGWQVGIPLIKPGGKITLYIPSGMGYGKRASGAIPANSVLVFNVDLVSAY